MRLPESIAPRLSVSDPLVPHPCLRRVIVSTPPPPPHMRLPRSCPARVAAMSRGGHRNTPSPNTIASDIPPSCQARATLYSWSGHRNIPPPDITAPELVMLIRITGAAYTSDAT